jgi:uncharacterized protein (TIGR00369 family)
VNEPLIKDDTCFACGKNNAIGLHLHFQVEGDDVCARTIIDARYQGWQGIVHGGIVTTLVDDAMAQVGAVEGYAGVVARIDIRFRKPVLVGETVQVRARIVEKRRNVLWISSEVTDAQGGMLATARGSFVCKGRMECEEHHGG